MPRVSTLLRLLFPLLLIIDCTSSLALRSPRGIAARSTDDVSQDPCSVDGDPSPFCEFFNAFFSAWNNNAHHGPNESCPPEEQPPFCMGWRSRTALSISDSPTYDNECPPEDKTPFCDFFRSFYVAWYSGGHPTPQSCTLEDPSPLYTASPSHNALTKSNGHVSDEDCSLDDQSPVCIDPLRRRDHAGATCPGTSPDQPLLHSIKPANTLGNGYEYLICCPDGYLSATFDLDGPACCSQDNSQNPTGCDIADGSLVLPASVNGCDKGWKKEKDKASKIQVCQRKL
jgi:hypothetical protein